MGVLFLILSVDPILPYKVRRIHALLAIVYEEHRAGERVAVRAVMIERNLQEITERVQSVVFKGGIAAAAHLHRAGVGENGEVLQSIGLQTAGEHAQIEGRVMRKQNAALHQRSYLRPKLRKAWRAIHV